MLHLSLYIMIRRLFDWFLRPASALRTDSGMGGIGSHQEVAVHQSSGHHEEENVRTGQHQRIGDEELQRNRTLRQHTSNQLESTSRFELTKDMLTAAIHTCLDNPRAMANVMVGSDLPAFNMSMVTRLLQDQT